MNRSILGTLLLCGFFLAGCSVRSSDSSFEVVQGVIKERISEKIVWREGAHEIKKHYII